VATVLHSYSRYQAVLQTRIDIWRRSSNAGADRGDGARSSRHDLDDTPTSRFREGVMRKLSHGVFIIALVAASGAAWAQQPQSPSSAPPAPSATPQPSPPSTPGTQATPTQSAAPAGAHSYIVNLHNGETVVSPFKVIFGLTSNMGVAPAGVEKPNVGHHHLLVDTTLKPEELTQPIPMDEHHLHFGKGQTETAVTLPPGKHTLQLVLGDWSHVPFNPSVQSAVITVNVKPAATSKASPKTRRAGLARRRQ
jgi:hypothetical protein